MSRKSDEKRLIDPNVQIRGQDTVIHFKDAIQAYLHFTSQEDPLAYELKAMPHKLVGMIVMAQAARMGLPPREAFSVAQDLTEYMHYICHQVATGQITVYHDNVATPQQPKK